MFVTLVQELYGIGSWEASNRNANKWKTLWRTFFGPESWNQKAQKTNRLLHQEFLKEKFLPTKKLKSGIDRKVLAALACNSG